MNIEQALKHNTKLREKIQEIESQVLAQFRIRIVEREDDGRRRTVEDFNTEFIPLGKINKIVKEYKDVYNDTKKFFFIVDRVELIKRRVDVALPTRTKEDRDPPAHIPDPPKEEE